MSERNAMTLLATHTALWLVFGLTVATIFAIVLAAVTLVYVAVSEGDAVADVQRFIELTEEARRLVPPSRLPLLDPSSAALTAEAINRFLDKKEEARRALWASRQPRAAAATAEPRRPSEEEAQATEHAA